MKYLPIKKDLFIQNRKSLIKILENNSIVIINSNDVMPTNSDGSMPFIQNSDLFWLTGIDQEESILLLWMREAFGRRKLEVKGTSFSIIR